MTCAHLSFPSAVVTLALPGGLPTVPPGLGVHSIVWHCPRCAQTSQAVQFTPPGQPLLSYETVVRQLRRVPGAKHRAPRGLP